MVFYHETYWQSKWIDIFKGGLKAAIMGISWGYNRNPRRRSSQNEEKLGRLGIWLSVTEINPSQIDHSCSKCCYFCSSQYSLRYHVPFCLEGKCHDQCTTYLQTRKQAVINSPPLSPWCLPQLLPQEPALRSDQDQIGSPEWSRCSPSAGEPTAGGFAIEDGSKGNITIPQELFAVRHDCGGRVKEKMGWIVSTWWLMIDIDMIIDGIANCCFETWKQMERHIVQEPGIEKRLDSDDDASGLMNLGVQNCYVKAPFPCFFSKKKSFNQIEMAWATELSQLSFVDKHLSFMFMVLHH